MPPPNLPKDSYSMSLTDWQNWLNDKGNEELLIDAWISYNEALEDSPEKDTNIWAYNVLESTLVYKDPQLSWSLILKILKSDLSDRVFSMLAAGPLEDLLGEHGDTIVPLVDKEAKKNPKFLKLLGGVWKNSISDENWKHIQSLVGENKW